MNPNPPNQPYQPYQPPMPRPQAPKPNPIAAAWNSSPWAKVGLILAAVLASCMLCSLCGTISTAMINSAAGSGAQPSQQHGNAPRTPAPTATPKATATPGKPTPTLSPAQQLAQSQADLQRIVKGNTNAKVETVALYSDGSAEVNINIGEQWDTGTAQTISKVDTFQLLRAIYSQWHSRPAKFVTVWLYVHGPTSDKYGNTNPDDLYASVSLTPQTAAKFNWDNLTSDTAWQAYDIALWAPVVQAG